MSNENKCTVCGVEAHMSVNVAGGNWNTPARFETRCRDHGGRFDFCNIEEHNAQQQRIEALEAALLRVHCYRNGYCRDCGEFTGWDAIQEIQGDEPHAQYCHIGSELALLSPSEAK